MNTPKPNDIYKHFKGNLYRILTLAQDADTGDRVVVYQALYGDNNVYVRALTAFTERLDRNKYPYAQQVHRFELMDNPFDSGSFDNKISPDTRYRDDDGEPAPAHREPEPAHREPEPAHREPEPAHREPAPARMEPEPDNGEPSLDPLLLDFLDNSGHVERLDILSRLRPRLTEGMINIMAAALETELMSPADDIDAAYSELRAYLFTMDKYEKKHR